VKTKILYFATRSICGGVAIHLLELLKHLGGSFQCGLAVGAEGFLTEQARQLGVDIFVVPEMVAHLDPWNDCRAIETAKHVIGDYAPDVVHAHMSKAGIIARLAARLAGVPSVFTAHGWAFAPERPLSDRIVGIPAEKLCARICRKIIVVSDHDRSLSLERNVAPPSKVEVVYCGISDSALRARPDVADPVTLVMPARFDKPKDQALLIQILPHLPKHARLLLVGDGPSRQDCEELTRRLQITDRVQFLGTSDRVAEILAESHIFVLTSNWEGLPISILEAMRAGLPVVSSDVGAIHEAVVQAEGGFLVPRGDGEALISKLSLLIQSPHLRAEMGHFNRQRYREVFTVERMVGAVQQIYCSRN